MSRLFQIFLLAPLSLATPTFAQTPQSHPTLRVAIVGLVHGHVHGFLSQYQHRPEIEIVAVVEPDPKLRSAAATRYGFQAAQLFADLDEMIAKTHAQAVLVYTSTYDHRRIVETCAHHGVHVMMEKPLAVSLEDALAMQKAARAGNIHVLVNYETSWYASNHAAYDLVRDGSLGDVRKVVVHDGHKGPKEIGVEPEFLSWLTDPKLNGGGALFDFGCYGADLMTYLGTRNIAIFSTDIDTFDFKMRKPDDVVKSAMTKLAKNGKGILLMHDFQHATAEAIPELLRQLKAGGFKIVHMVPKAPVTTLAKYDDMVKAKDKFSSTNNTRPESSVVKTINE